MRGNLGYRVSQDGKQNGGVVEGSEDGGNSGSGESLPHTTSGAKMLADAEFLVSLTGGGAGTPSGTPRGHRAGWMSLDISKGIVPTFSFGCRTMEATKKRGQPLDDSKKSQNLG